MKKTVNLGAVAIIVAYMLVVGAALLVSISLYVDTKAKEAPQYGCNEHGWLFSTQFMLESTTRLNNRFDDYEEELAYRDAIENLMLSESFVPSRYKCPSGSETIGFGHVIKSGEHFPEKINFRTGYQLLLSDFNGCLALSEELKYTGVQRVAVAHAIYCLGLQTVKKINNFEASILKYNHYTCNGVSKTSVNLDFQREFEYNLFKNN